VAQGRPLFEELRALTGLYQTSGAQPPQPVVEKPALHEPVRPARPLPEGAPAAAAGPVAAGGSARGGAPLEPAELAQVAELDRALHRAWYAGGTSSAASGPCACTWA